MEETIVAKFTYFKDADSDNDPEYSRAEDMMTIMRQADEDIIEIKVSPEASKRDDALYIRVPAQALMAALTKVLMQIPEKD